MKRLRFLFLYLIVIFVAAPASAEKTLTEKVTHQSTFNNITDWLATVGKSDIEKERIKRARKEARRIDRLQRIHAAKVKKHRKTEVKKEKAFIKDLKRQGNL